MAKRPEPNPHVMLNLLQHLDYSFLLSADPLLISLLAYPCLPAGRNNQNPKFQ
jgi:hypothetical protein